MRGAPYAVPEVLFGDHLVLGWSYNAHGTGREHLAIGDRVTGWRGRRTAEGSSPDELHEAASAPRLHVR